MGNIGAKLLGNGNSVTDQIFDVVRERSLESFKEIVLNPALDDEQRKMLLNSVTNNGHTVLQQAAGCGKADIITWLLSDEGRAAGFYSVLAKSNNGFSALHDAAQFGHVECCKAIVNGCREDNGERHEMLNAVGNDGWTVLHAAARVGGGEVITWLLTEGVDAGFDRKNITALIKSESSSALHFAAMSNVECIQALLSHCGNEERMNLFLCVDSRGWTALHHAARRVGHSTISALLQYRECSLIANRKDNSGMTVLHRAIIGGIDEKSRSEWSHSFKPNPSIIRALLGSPTATTIDPNIGIGLE